MLVPQCLACVLLACAVTASSEHGYPRKRHRKSLSSRHLAGYHSKPGIALPLQLLSAPASRLRKRATSSDSYEVEPLRRRTSGQGGSTKGGKSIVAEDCDDESTTGGVEDGLTGTGSARGKGRTDEESIKGSWSVVGSYGYGSSSSGAISGIIKGVDHSSASHGSSSASIEIDCVDGSSGGSGSDSASVPAPLPNSPPPPSSPAPPPSSPAPPPASSSSSAVPASSSSGAPAPPVQVGLSTTQAQVIAPVAATAKDSSGFGVLALYQNEAAYELGYFVEVLLGSPPQPFRLHVDVSSADIFVPASDCTACAAGHPKLGASTSSSFVAQTDKSWETTYSSSILFSAQSALTNVSGYGCRDRLAVAGLPLDGFSFGVATQMDNEYAADWLPFHGVLGCANSKAFPAVSRQGIKSPIVQLVEAGAISQGILAISIGRASSPGQLHLGGIDDSAFIGSLVKLPSVSPYGYWELGCDSITFSGRAAYTYTGRTTVFDTRSTTILAPLGDIAALGLTTASDGSGQVLLPCNDPGLLLKFTFGGTPFPVRPSDLVVLPSDDTGCGAPPCCVSALQAAPTELGLPSTQWILGTAFLKNAYLCVDFDDNTVARACLPLQLCVGEATSSNANTVGVVP